MAWGVDGQPRHQRTSTRGVVAVIAVAEPLDRVDERFRIDETGALLHR